MLPDSSKPVSDKTRTVQYSVTLVVFLYRDNILPYSDIL